MAVPTVALDFPVANRVGNTAMGVLSGKVTISSYDTAHPEVTAISKKFLAGGKLQVIPEGVSSLGYVVEWDTATKSFKAYKPAAPAVTISAGAIASAALVGSTTSVTTSHVAAAAETLVVSGGTVSSIVIVRGGTSASHPVSGDVHLEAGDLASATFTSGAAPTITSFPIAALPSATATEAVPTEASNSDNVGVVSFIAVGQMG